MPTRRARTRGTPTHIVYRKQKGRQSNVLYNEVADGRRRRSERSGTPFRPTPFGTFRGNGQLSCSHGHDKLYHTRVTVSKFFLTALPEPCRCHMYVLVFFWKRYCSYAATVVVNLRAVHVRALCDALRQAMPVSLVCCCSCLNVTTRSARKHGQVWHMPPRLDARSGSTRV